MDVGYWQPPSDALIRIERVGSLILSGRAWQSARTAAIDAWSRGSSSDFCLWPSPLGAAHYHVDIVAAALRADQPLSPLRHAHLGAVALGHLGRVGLDAADSSGSLNRMDSGSRSTQFYAEFCADLLEGVGVHRVEVARRAINDMDGLPVAIYTRCKYRNRGVDIIAVEPKSSLGRENIKILVRAIGKPLAVGRMKVVPPKGRGSSRCPRFVNI